MSSKRDNKGRLPPFVPLLRDTMSTPAWRAASHGSRSLYIALRARVNNDGRNNGRVFLSKRTACQEIGSSDEQITRWFRELQHFGFIVQTAAGCLGSDGHGKAPHWRLTELGSRAADGTMEPPTRDFVHWTGERFRPSPTLPPRKNRIPVRKTAHQRAENRTSGGAENRAQKPPKRAENRTIGNASKRAENRTIASNQLPVPIGASTTPETIDLEDAIEATRQPKAISQATASDLAQSQRRSRARRTAP